jgi:ferredoxin
MSKLTVWINQDKCTGSGLCLEECPSMFVHNEKGKGRIKKADGSLVTGVENRVEVAPEHHKTVIAAFDACPTSAIGIEQG